MSDAAAEATPAEAASAAAMAANPTLASLSEADRALHHSRMSLALAEADAALAEDEVPVGCAIVLASSGRVLATGRNQTNQTKNATRHCEFVALEQIYAAQRRREPDFVDLRMEDCVLYVTVEPCIMCASALRLARIGLVVYGCGNDRFGGNGSVLPLHRCPSLDSNTPLTLPHQPPLQPPVASNDLTTLPPLLGAGYPSLSGVRAAEAIDVLKRFYARGNQNIPIEKRHRKGVAAATAAVQQQQQAQHPQGQAASTAVSAVPVPSPAAAGSALSTSASVPASPSPAPSASPDTSPIVVTPASAASSSSSPPVDTALNSSQAPPPLSAATASVASSASPPAATAAPTAKSKGSPPAPAPAASTASVSARRAALKGEDAWKRMNFLYQSSHLLAVGGGMGAAGTALSRVYLMNMKKIATKLVMRLDPSVKNSVCKRCGSLLLPGHSADVRVESSGGMEAMVEIDESGENDAGSANAAALAADTTAATSPTVDAMQIDAPSESNAPSTTAPHSTPASEAAPAVAVSANAPAAVVSDAPLPSAPSRKLRRRRRRAPGTHHRRSPLAVDPPRVILVCHTCGTSKRMHTKQYGASADS